MSGEHAVLYSFALYCLAVLLPVVPATIIFKLFPDTKVSVTGPLYYFRNVSPGTYQVHVGGQAYPLSVQQRPAQDIGTIRLR